MSSVADQLRREYRRAELGKTPEERFLLALALGDDDLDTWARARGIDRDQARRELRARRQRGRRPSDCLAALER